MEFRAPFPPTPVVHRRAAVKAYLDGEALCDRGDTKAGIEKMRQAQLLAWELDASDWPAWADHLYSELVNGTPPPPPPPLLGPSSDDEVSSVFLPACLRPCCPIQQWWDRPEALDAISSTLDDQHFVVIDGFAGSAVAQTFRDACEAQWRTGRRFHPAKVAQPGGGTDGARSVLTRSDHITWVDVNGRVDDCEGEGENEEEEAENGEGDEENDRTREFYSGLRSIVRRVDALIRLLRPRLKVEEGGDDGTAAAVVTRQRPQVARYGEGDAFARHCDNYCPVGGHGPYCNERWLTCVYYASDREWRREVDGGCLRVYRPQGDARRDDDEEEQQDEGQASGAAPPREDSVAAHTYEEDAVVDIAPLADRLLLFRSDFRVPHAVLPVTSAKARYAVTCWINRKWE